MNYGDFGAFDLIGENNCVFVHGVNFLFGSNFKQSLKFFEIFLLNLELKKKIANMRNNA